MLLFINYRLFIFQYFQQLNLFFVMEKEENLIIFRGNLLGIGVKGLVFMFEKVNKSKMVLKINKKWVCFVIVLVYVLVVLLVVIVLVIYYSFLWDLQLKIFIIVVFMLGIENMIFIVGSG